MFVSVNHSGKPYFIVSSSTSEDIFVRKQESVDIWQVVPLVLAAGLLTIGLTMVLSGTNNLVDVVQPVIVVFGGALAGSLLTFTPKHLSHALQLSMSRGLRGGTAPEEMVRALLKVCEVCRRDGLLGVAEIRSNSNQLEEVCGLIGDAADEQTIRIALKNRIAIESRLHQMATDVFFFMAIYASLIGLLGSLLLFASANESIHYAGVSLPFVCGISLAILLSILIGRLRAAHYRELLVSEIAYRGAMMMLDDNNSQRLNARLSLMLMSGLNR